MCSDEETDYSAAGCRYLRPAADALRDRGVTATVQAHLYMTEDQSVALRELDLELNLQCVDLLNVGFSYKFHRSQFVAEVVARGFDLRAQWNDTV